MKKRIAVLSLLLVFIAVWVLLYGQYQEYIVNKERTPNDESSTYMDPKKETNRGYVNSELYEYLHGFLFTVIDAQFGIIVGKSGIARMDYIDGKVDLIEAVTLQDAAYADLERVVGEFKIPTFGNLTTYEKDSLHKIYDEVQGIKEAYLSQITGQKGLTFALAMEKGDESFNVEAYSYEEQKNGSQKMVDESLDEILAFQLRVDTLCHEVIENMEKK